MIKKEKNKGGRPTIMTEQVVAKLEQGFKIGLNDTECCAYADISRDAFYDYIKKNPEFADKKEKWKLNPIAKAKHTIYKKLDDVKTAQWYLEKRCDEFSSKSKIELTNKALTIMVADEQHKKMLEDL